MARLSALASHLLLICFPRAIFLPSQAFPPSLLGPVGYLLRLGCAYPLFLHQIQQIRQLLVAHSWRQRTGRPSPAQGPQKLLQHACALGSSAVLACVRAAAAAAAARSVASRRSLPRAAGCARGTRAAGMWRNAVLAALPSLACWYGKVRGGSRARRCWREAELLRCWRAGVGRACTAAGWPSCSRHAGRRQATLEQGAWRASRPAQQPVPAAACLPQVAGRQAAAAALRQGSHLRLQRAQPLRTLRVLPGQGLDGGILEQQLGLHAVQQLGEGGCLLVGCRPTRGGIRGSRHKARGSCASM